jgi:sirohydrochlorin cobaltochelatase
MNATNGVSRATRASGFSRRAFAGMAATGIVGGSMAIATATQAASAEEASPAAHKPVILVVSFGTSYNDSRHITIGAIEDTIRERYYPDYEVRRAFTAQTIIDKLAERDGVTIDSVEQALDRIVEDGVDTLVVQPTHLMAGKEYTDLASTLQGYSGKIASIALGQPLLTSDDDYEAVIGAITDAMEPYDDGQTAICLIGHGTDADSNADYATLQEKLTADGLTQYFVATVEATPTFDDVVSAVAQAGYKKAALRPLMVVAGDHANNDMADTGDPDSFASKFVAAGIEPTCVIEGLGQLVAIDQIYADHVAASIAAL